MTYRIKINGVCLSAMMLFLMASGAPVLATAQEAQDSAVSVEEENTIASATNPQGTPLIQPEQEPYSVFVGKGAGSGDNTEGKNLGRFNTAVGFGAFASNYSGSASVAIGTDALASNITGTKNTAVGYRAMLLDLTGSNNTAIGYHAMIYAKSGNNNTALGYGALHGGWYKNKDANGNLLVSFSGNGNTAIGMQTMYNMQTGNQNVAVGEYTMGGSQDPTPGHNTASNNVAVGRYALRFVDTGSNNVAIGHTTLGKLADGSNNIAIGYLAGYELQNNASNNIMIGREANVPDPYGSNQMNIGNVIYGSLATGEIGIGTAQPRATLDVNGYIRLASNGAAPAACGAHNAGSLALTKGYSLCSCNGAEWNYADSRGGNCVWTR